MKVSIIIPIYNVEPYVEDCVRSVISQNYEGQLECVLVDDCGTDGSMEIVQEIVSDYQGNIEFKILHHEYNRGLSAARNTGMDAAEGDYVFFLDSDDWISNDCISLLAEKAQEGVVDIVVGNYQSEGIRPCDLELSMKEGLYHEKGITHTFCDNGVYVMAWNKLFKKEFLMTNKLRFEEGKLHEDEILAFDLSCVDKSFYVIKAITYYYRIREASITMNSNVNRKLESYIGILNSVKNRVGRYKGVKGVYDFYLFWVNRVFGLISRFDLDDSNRDYVQNETIGFLEVIPNIGSLEEKHNRYIYYACHRDQTFSRYMYVTQVSSKRVRGKIMRNLLSLIPAAKGLPNNVEKR